MTSASIFLHFFLLFNPNTVRASVPQAYFFSNCRLFSEDLVQIGTISGDRCTIRQNGEFATYDSQTNLMTLFNKDSNIIWKNKVDNFDGFRFSNIDDEIFFQSYSVENNDFCKTKMSTGFFYSTKTNTLLTKVRFRKIFDEIFRDQGAVPVVVNMLKFSKANDAHDCEFESPNQMIEIPAQTSFFPKTKKVFLVLGWEHLSIFDHQLKKKIRQIDLFPNFHWDSKMLISSKGSLVFLNISDSQEDKVRVVKVNIAEASTILGPPKGIFGLDFRNKDRREIALGSFSKTASGYLFMLRENSDLWTAYNIDFNGRLIWKKNFDSGELEAFETPISIPHNLNRTGP